MAPHPVVKSPSRSHPWRAFCFKIDDWYSGMTDTVEEDYALCVAAYRLTRA